MLRGEAEYALDDKGRVVIPPKFRAEIGERVVVTRWMEPCLAAFSPVEWQRVEEKLRNQPLKNVDVVRLLLSAAEDCDLDRQGRIYLPPHLREYAGISRSVTIIGMASRLELWSTPAWRAKLKKFVASRAALQKRMEEVNL